MIARIWHGWTTPDNADAYEALLLGEVIPGIEAKGVAGFHSIEVLRRDTGAGEVEFVTIMHFDSWEAVKAFAGEDFERACVPSAARQLLARFDERSQHFEVRSAGYTPG
jgi:antibiotic biosynthesis monooxygenase (ABM) superfamily enzyme